MQQSVALPGDRAAPQRHEHRSQQLEELWLLECVGCEVGKSLEHRLGQHLTPGWSFLAHQIHKQACVISLLHAHGGAA
ncbi:similar to hypothetical protein MGC14141 (predicted), isoform CRA_b [Rattus norvegicus]|uniref:Uncharacterized protein RGD1561492_predicted n=1 Tax=Rattus norvegicus TaxID=10116 RepID=A6JT90_RAT|nr:similar to hypothetical protein MGC14141 (predicted), isoform CRA_b [Rattus norvegicus]